MDSRSLKQSVWAKQAGVPESTLRSFLGGKSSALRHDTLEKLALAAQATVAEIIGEKPRDARLMKDVIAIKSLEVRASMGGGCEVMEEPEGPPFYFRRSWIEKLVDDMPAQLRVLTRLEGDSMSPTINEGDIGLIMLPGNGQPFQSGAIYVLWDGRGLLIKRLEATVGERQRLRVISDNAAIYPAYEVDADDVRIIGRILWRGGRV